MYSDKRLAAKKDYQLTFNSWKTDYQVSATSNINSMVSGTKESFEWNGSE